MVDRARASAKMRVVNDGATALSMAAILSFGALEVFRNLTSSGNVVAAMAVVGFLSNAFRDLGRVHEYLQTYRVSRQKILEFMETKALRGRSSKRASLEVGNGTIELQKVSIDGALKELSGSIAGGTKLAIIGDNGAGKSTLLQAIARLIDLNKGTILIDGQDISQCNLASIRQAVSIVSPDLPLLKGSVRFNLKYRSPEADKEELEQVKQLCELDHLLATLPGGEKFRLREGGQNLSLGQRHKLAIARSLLGKPAILIVDEMDANLDKHAAQILEKVIQNFKGTVLMVSRAEERLSLADCYWHLEAGELVKITEKRNNRQLNIAES
jgi:ABC-type bacteriocin/lantibiotic exporter with double-glycine peptidase domain